MNPLDWPVCRLFPTTAVSGAQKAVAEDIIHLEMEIHQLMMKKQILENETEVLTRDRDDLNRTLGVIMTFQNFPVSKFCPDKREYIKGLHLFSFLNNQ